jgi:hypothetical protein
MKMKKDRQICSAVPRQGKPSLVLAGKRWESSFLWLMWRVLYFSDYGSIERHALVAIDTVTINNPLD